MKVELIAQSKVSFFEDSVNNFIKDKKVIDIKFAVDEHYNKYALVIYEEQDEENKE